jgi:DNA modification methylase
MWRYNLIWKKGNRVTGFLNAGNQPLRCHEDICVFYQDQCTYNPQKTKGEINHVKTRNNATKEEKVKQGCYGDFIFNSTDLSGMKHPKSIIDIDKEYDFKELFHPTQKPVDLLRYLILTYSNEGDTILDATIGSGTTAVAALMEKRHFIGFETNKEYFDIAQGRIDQVLRNPTLF